MIEVSQAFPLSCRLKNLLAVSVLLSLSACGGCGNGGGLDAGPSTVDGAGVLVRDGAEQAYTIDTEDSHFIIVVINKDSQFGCGLFHSHAVEAESYGLNFRLDADAPENSELSLEVAASGLNPDSPENRARYPETSVSDLNENERGQIKSSMLEQLDAANNPTLTFTASNFTALEGEGTIDLDVDLAGAQSTLTMTYEGVFEGDKLIITGIGTLDGTQHGIPNGFASDCVESDMTLDLRMVLVPGTLDGGLDAGVIEEYVPTVFPYEGDCVEGTTVSFNEVRDVLGAACAGCHGAEPSLGATVPLVTWDDYRVDSARNPGRPLYETAYEFITDPGSAAPMPPEGVVNPLTDEQKALFVRWYEQGAPDCLDLAPAKTFDPVPSPPNHCAPVSFNDDIAPLMANNCTYCHSADQDALPIIDTDYSRGLDDATHPYYASEDGPLNIWEVSMYRVMDGSMPPFAGGALYDDQGADVTQLFIDWVASGYPENHCGN